MKQIVAYIRPDKHFETRDALEKAGFGAFHSENVIGRGRQNSLYEFVNGGGQLPPGISGGQMFAKKELTIVVNDQDVDAVVAELLAVNRTGVKGDGKIFVMPVVGAVRIRTGECGEDALL
ncbi:MAG: P-II family nitrogen regulator [Clostridiales bacterium]|nr:P-II family nitrogen regulator [Clostridiales bacterium]